MTVELKIKFKSLAEESRIIRREELKLRGYGRYLIRRDGDSRRVEDPEVNDWTKWFFTEFGANEMKLNSLNHHRRHVVRNVARATHLARAFLKGKSASLVEEKVLDASDLKNTIVPKVVAMINKYGGVDTTVEEFADWYDEDRPEAVLSA